MFNHGGDDDGEQLIPGDVGAKVRHEAAGFEAEVEEGGQPAAIADGAEAEAGALAGLFEAEEDDGAGLLEAEAGALAGLFEAKEDDGAGALATRFEPGGVELLDNGAAAADRRALLRITGAIILSVLIAVANCVLEAVALAYEFEEVQEEGGDVAAIANGFKAGRRL